ncbi:c-Myc-binding protein-like [Oratosquilla oratoria]|uniref:c-Myc-binding protein-like n=1 Tax=Oratosquilla oratoria TaxID=337810 RepID=UPI003F766155
MSMDSEREKFRTYMEKTGVMSALTKVFVDLYEKPEKPQDALEYVTTALGAVVVEKHQLEMLEEKVKEMQETIEKLEKENSMLKEKMCDLENKEKSIATKQAEGNA